MRVRERVHDVRASWHDVGTDLDVWPEVTPHRDVRLREAQRLCDGGVKRGRVALPRVQRHRRDPCGKRGLSGRVRREKLPQFGRNAGSPCWMRAEEGKKP